MLKTDYIWWCLIHSINFPTKHAELDLSEDETSWATSSYCEAGGGLKCRISNNPGITKGGQTVLAIDVHRTRPRAYRHRHKLHVKPHGWNIWGKIEVKEIM